MAEPTIRLLIVEDDPDDYLILRKMLESSRGTKYDLDRASTYEEAMEKLGQGGYDTCLLDFRLQGKNGLEFLSESNKRGYKTPIILLTGQGDHQVDMDAMRQGAADFLHKAKLDPDRLERVIRYALERKKAQDALRQSEDFFRAVIENNLDGLSVIESDGRVRYTSPSVQGILGYSTEERIGANTFELLHPDDFPRAMEIFEQLLRTPGGALKTEVRARHKDGSWRFVELSGKNHQFLLPPSQAIILNFRDITDQKKASDLRDRLAAIVETSHDAIFTVSPQGIILSWNPAAQRIFGYNPEEAGGREISLLLNPDNTDSFHHNLKKVM